MPSICERRLVVTGCVAVLLVLAPIGFAAPAAAQCLSETECDSLRTQLREIKSARSADKITWDDYGGTGVLSAVAAEMNRYAYTGYAAAGMKWMETVWPGNDRVKGAFLEKLRETRSKSVFAEDIRVLSTDTR